MERSLMLVLRGWSYALPEGATPEMLEGYSMYSGMGKFTKAAR
jgi:hypothetical protein